MMFRSISLAAVLLGLAGYSAEGGSILSSDFNVQTSVQGTNEFTGIVWLSDAAISPVNSVYVSDKNNDAIVQRNGASANTSRLAVSHNIDSAGPVAFIVGVLIDSSHDVSLSSLSFDYQFINGNGLDQTLAHPDSGIFTFGITDASTGMTLGVASVGPLGTSSVISNSGSATITLGTPATLLHDGAYYLGLQVSSNATLGNNIAVDNFNFQGVSSVYTPPSSVPEPSTFALLGLGGIGLVVRTLRRRRVTV